MGFEQVEGQYVCALFRQKRRADRRKRDFFTKAEQAANKYYWDAIRAIQRLEPAREGTKILAEDLHAENPDMRGQELDKLPADSGRAE